MSASASLLCVADVDTLPVDILKTQLRIVLYGGGGVQPNGAGAPSDAGDSAYTAAQLDAARQSALFDAERCGAGDAAAAAAVCGRTAHDMYEALVEHIGQCADDAANVHSLEQIHADLRNTRDACLGRYARVLAIVRDYMAAMVRTGGRVYADTFRAHLALYTRACHAESVRRVLAAMDAAVAAAGSGDASIAADGRLVCSLSLCVALVDGSGETGTDFSDVCTLLRELATKAGARGATKDRLPMATLRAHLLRVHRERVERREFAIELDAKGTALAVRIPAYGCTVTMHASFAVQTKGAKSFTTARRSVDFFTELLRTALPGDAFCLCDYAPYNTMVWASVGERIDLASYAAAASPLVCSRDGDDAGRFAGSLRHEVSFGAQEAPPPTGDESGKQPGGKKCASGRLYHYVTIAAGGNGADRGDSVHYDTSLRRGRRRRRRRSGADVDGCRVTVSVFSSGMLWIVGARQPDHVEVAFEASRNVVRAIDAVRPGPVCVDGDV